MTLQEKVDKMKKQRKDLINQLRQQVSIFRTGSCDICGQISKDDITSSIIGQKDDKQEVRLSW